MDLGENLADFGDLALIRVVNYLTIFARPQGMPVMFDSYIFRFYKWASIPCAGCIRYGVHKCSPVGPVV